MARQTGLRNVLVLTSSPSMIIARESAKYDGLENGGLLLGQALPNNVFLVTEVTGGGPNAQRSAASFSPDVEYLNERIREGESKGFRFIGEWHLHPGSLSSPSRGDEETIRKTIEDNPINAFIALIVNMDEPDTPPRLYAYVFQRNEEIRPISVRIVDDREVGDVMPWFMSADGKKRLILETKSMARSFPSFKLHKKQDIVFWKGDYAGHEILLLYPQDFPQSTIKVETIPPVSMLEGETEHYYASIAAQAAYLRIDSEAEVTQVERGLPSSLGAPSIPTEASRDKHWYKSGHGKQMLADISRQLKTSVSEVQSYRLSDGRVGFRCGLDEEGKQSLMLILPQNFPTVQPEVHAYVGDKEVQVELLPPEVWTTKPSIIGLIRHVSSQLQDATPS